MQITFKAKLVQATLFKHEVLQVCLSNISLLKKI